MTPVRPMAVGWSKERHTTHKRGFSSFMAVGWSKRVLRLFANGLPLDMKDSSREHSETQGQRCARQCSHPVLKTWQTSKRAHTDEQPRAPQSSLLKSATERLRVRLRTGVTNQATDASVRHTQSFTQERNRAPALLLLHWQATGARAMQPMTMFSLLHWQATQAR